jgi:hypothetical protein
MQIKQNRMRALCTALLITALGALGLASSASAELSGEFKVFEQCPWTNPEAARCLYSVTEGGEVILGNKKVPIVNPAVVQAGYTEPEGEFAHLVAAKNGVTLSKAPQPVPGGLVGLVPPESSPPLVKAALKLALENGFTGVNSTLELAKPANQVLISELHLAEETGVTLRLPLKIHLENPFLGANCYVGSESNPVIWELTTGTTSPEAPNAPITGSPGAFEFLEEGQVIRTKGAELVDNNWSAPGASGCGGLLSFLVDPIINATTGLPAAKGVNTAILENTITISTSFGVQLNFESNL